MDVYTQDGKLFVEGQREDGETDNGIRPLVWMNTLVDLSLDHGPNLVTSNDWYSQVKKKHTHKTENFCRGRWVVHRVLQIIGESVRSVKP